MKKIIVFIILLPTIAISKTNYLNDRFHHLNIKDGLSSCYITDMIQDQTGFIWIATSNGLHRYDGSSFTVYNHESNNPNSLSHSSINSIVESKDGVLWVATSDGLNRFDPKTSRNKRFFDDGQHRIFKIILSNDGFLWAGTRSQGVIRFNIKTFTSEYFQYHSNDSNSLCSNTIEALYIDQANCLWVGTINGLNKFNTTTQTFQRFTHQPNDINSLYNNRVTAIFQDSKGNFWVGSDGALQQLEISSGQFTNILFSKNISRRTTHNIRFINEDSWGNLWIGTSSSGLWMNYQKNGQWKNFRKNSSEFSLVEDSLLSFLHDRSGVLWFGSTSGGINLLFPKYKEFEWIIANPDISNSIGGNYINDIMEDHQGKIWMAINGFGLSCLNPKTNQIQHFSKNHKQSSKIAKSIPLCMIEDHQHNIWIGTWGNGLFCYQRDTGIFTHYQYNSNNPNSISSNVIYDLLLDHTNTLWIATWGGGLNRFNFETQLFDHFKHEQDKSDTIIDNRVCHIYEDHNHNLWISCIGSGVDRFVRATESFIHLSKNNDANKLLTRLTIHRFYEDKSHRFWLGSITNGLILFNRQTEDIKVYTTKNGLVSNLIVDILEDDHGNLWISTNNGLSCFNPDTETFRNFDEHDGLSSSTFNLRASIKNKHGKLFFGGIKGINTFYPEKIKHNPFITPVALTDFKLFNQSVPVCDKSPLDSHITYLDHLILTHEESVFSFNFAAFNYVSPQKNKYAYHMSNVDRDWVYVKSNQAYATYTKLPYGKYTFQVKAANNDGIWNESPISIKLTLLAPWWQTLWFRILICLSFLCLIFIYFYSRLHRIKKAKQVLEYEVTQRTHDLQITNKQLADEKDRFVQLMNSLDQSIYVADMKTYELLFINKKIRDTIGDIEGQLCWKSIQKNQTGPCPFCTNHLLLNNNDLPNEIYTWEFKNTLTKRWYYIQDRAIKWRDNRWVRMEIATDITKIKNTEHDLKLAKEKAESANKAKTLFLAHMSHELRTPLNSILGFSDLIIRKRQHDPTESNYLNSIQKNGEHLLSIINDILDLSKMEENQTVLKERAISLNDFISDIKHIMFPSAQQKHLLLNFYICDQLPQYIQVDDLKLRQILINLINNAIKYTDEGHIDIHVKLDNSITKPNNGIQLLFDIIDTGTGISVDDPDTLFEMFTQSSTQKTDTQHGVGLGLTICKKFVHLMGGDIRIEKKSDNGAHFSFEIPAIAIESIEVQKDQKNVIGLKPGHQSYKILVVDDIASNRKILVDALVSVGFDVQEAENGQLALDVWQNWSPDLIWLDMFMPILNGFDVAMHIRKMETEASHVIIIAVSASSFEEDRIFAIDAGCDDFLLKPFKFNNMFELMANHLNISYIYDKTSIYEDKRVEVTDEELRRIIQDMPKTVQLDLKNGILTLDSQKTKKAIQNIEKKYPFAGTILLDWVKKYDFNRLQSLI